MVGGVARRISGLAAAALLVSSCEEPLPPHFGTLRYESDNLEVWASDGLVACGGTYDYQERWLEEFRRRVGPYSTGERHTLYWYDGQITPEMCGRALGGRAACAWLGDNVSYTTFMPADHELAHLDLGEYHPMSFIIEGAAEVFGTSPDGFAGQRPEEDHFNRSQISYGLYPSAGRFARHLIDEYGLELFLDLYRELDGATSFEEFQTAAESLTGENVDPMLDEYSSSWSKANWYHWRFLDTPCRDAELHRLDERGSIELDIEADCARDDVIGSPEWRVWTYRKIEVLEKERYELSVRSPDPLVEVVLVSCQTETESRLGSRQDLHLYGDNGVDVGHLVPGTFLLWVSHDGSSTARSTIRLKPYVWKPPPTPPHQPSDEVEQ